MPRSPMITRTIQTTKAVIFCNDKINRTGFEQEITLPRTLKNEKAILKEAQKILNSESVVAAYVVSTEVTEQRYGMTEQEFIAVAHTIPPLKKYNKNTEEETEEDN